MISKSITKALEIKLLTLTTRWVQKTSIIFDTLTLPIAFQLIIFWIASFIISGVLSFIITLYIH